MFTLFLCALNDPEVLFENLGEFKTFEDGVAAALSKIPTGLELHIDVASLKSCGYYSVRYTDEKRNLSVMICLMKKARI